MANPNLILDLAFQAWVAETVEKISGIRPGDFDTEPDYIPVIHEMRRARMCGVYYLYNGEDLQYIGQTTNLYSRLTQHMQVAPFEFDAYQFQEFAQADLNRREADAINVHQPKWNRMYPAVEGRKGELRGPWAETQLKVKQ